MTGATVLWGLATGFITGVVFTAIVLLTRQRRGMAAAAARIDDLEDRLAQLAGMGAQVRALEQRVGLSEREMIGAREEPVAVPRQGAAPC